jgi:prepilin-type N-terminal cleavage/methylation domain-containing protein
METCKQAFRPRKAFRTGQKSGQHKMKKEGFSLVEMIVVIAIVGILAAVIAPGYIRAMDKAKWSEACATAGSIRSAVLAYAAETGITDAQALVGSNLGDASVRTTLGYEAFDLDGTYFSPGDYTISAVSSTGVAEITASGGSKSESPSGTYKLDLGGDWVKQ